MLLWWQYWYSGYKYKYMDTNALEIMKCFRSVSPCVKSQSSHCILMFLWCTVHGSYWLLTTWMKSLVVLRNNLERRRRREAALAWWGEGGYDTRAYICYSISDRSQTRHNTDMQPALRASFMFEMFHILVIVRPWTTLPPSQPTYNLYHYPKMSS